MRARILSVAAVIVAVATAALPGWLQPLDDALTDSRFALSGRAASGDIVMVDIDSKTLAAIGRWPLPRRLYGDAIDRLVGLGAAEIAFDIDFSAASTPEDDAAMEAALTRAGDAVILAAFEQPVTAGGKIASNRPIQRFAKHAWLAGVNLRLDPDGKVRHLPYATGGGPDPIPSLAALYGGGPASSGQEFRIDFGIAATGIARLSLIDVLQGKVEKRRILGKKIIVGGQAIELRDYFLVPRYGFMSGSLVQALGAETIAAGRSLSRTNQGVTGIGLVAVALLAFSLWYRRWETRLVAIGLAGLALEVIATLVQRAFPLEVATGAWQAALLGYAVVALLREIDLRRILVAISRSETANTQTILARVIADSYGGILVFDADNTIVAASRSAGEILQRTGNLVGARDDMLPAELAAALTYSSLAAPAESVSGEVTCRRGSEDMILEYVVTPSWMDGGLGPDGDKRPDTHVVCLTFRDVTERRRAAEKISYLARFDSLTGLANRNQLIERLTLAVARYRDAGERSVVVSLDLDRFKAVNDALGPGVGDRLLSAVAGRLREMTRSADLVARLGGDNFAVVLSGDDAAARGHALAERLIASGDAAYQVDAHRLIAGMSAGIATLEAGETDPLAVLQRSDTALRKAKAAGGNTIELYDAPMAAEALAGRHLEQELWEAFRRNEFDVFYQPIVDLATGRIIGSEALLRWRHPVRGLMSPAEFVPTLETVGLMPAVGRWVLQTASAEAVNWPADIHISVNVSPVQFMRGNLREAVADVLRGTGLLPARLTLEITESHFLQATHAVSATMDSILATGVRFALDDFGMGYSSFAYVRKFRIGTIKIDQSFVIDIPGDEEAVAIVRAISALAKSLGIRVVAEGIESIEQARFVRLLGCNIGQGYLYGPPMPATDFAALLARQADSPRLERTAASSIAEVSAHTATIEGRARPNLILLDLNPPKNDCN